MSKLKLSLLTVAILIVILGGVSQRHALACEFVGFSDYAEIAPNIFASASFDKNQIEESLSVIQLSQSRINNVFGTMASFPKMVIAATEVEAASFGSNLYGSALLSPLGQCVVIGPSGNNVDVIAHEIAHAEVHFRVGWLNHMLNVPIWLNEGLALLVDYREPYLMENINLTQKEIDAVKNNSFDFSIKSYQASRVLVKSIEPTQLYRNLEKLKDGQDISRVFAL